MINTNEIRRNNTIVYDDIYYKILEIREHDLVIVDYAHRFTQLVSSIHCQPLEISDTVLMMLGFIKAPHGDLYGGWLKSNNAKTSSLRIMKDYTYVINMSLWIQIESAHHLQNLYQDIVKEGLPFKP